VSFLPKILDAHRTAAANDTRSLDALVEEAAAVGGVRDFAGALRDGSGMGVISEIKRRSPSKGTLNTGLDPVEMSQAYAAGGASCISVLTDEEFFGGSAADLQAVRGGCDLPVIRKDFTVAAADVADARIMGADAVLLIVAALDDAELTDFHALATELGMGVLVETHDEAEVERALNANATMVGVNQRDLVTFEVDTARAVRVGQMIPTELVRVAESGIGGPEDIPALAAAGFDAVLVGESLVRSGDPAKAVADLRAV
jgi:indole-3-glycerol phosphate synthase